MDKTFVNYEAELARLHDLLMKSEMESKHWKAVACEHEEELRKLRIIIKTIETVTGREFNF